MSLKGEEISGLSLDFEKAFDRIPHEHIFQLAQIAGLPAHLVDCLKAAYGKLQRHFRIGPFIGEGFSSTNGILQGCPLSIILLNLIMHVWAEGVSAECPGCNPQCYADDASTTCKESPRSLQPVLDFTSEFSLLTGMRANAKKSLAWATGKTGQSELKALRLEGKQLYTASHEHLLGAQMLYNGAHVAQRCCFSV